MFKWLRDMIGQGKPKPTTSVCPLVGATDKNIEQYTREALTGTSPTPTVPTRKETKLTSYPIKYLLDTTHDYTTWVIEPPRLREEVGAPNANQQAEAAAQSKTAGDYFCTEIAKQLSEYAAKPSIAGSTRTITYNGRSTYNDTQRFASDDPDCNIEAFIRGIEKEKDIFSSHNWPHLKLYLKDENGENYLFFNTGIVEKIDVFPFDIRPSKPNCETITNNQLFCITTVNPRGNKENQVLRTLVELSLAEVVKKLEADGKGKYASLTIDEFKAKEYPTAA